MFLPCQVPRRAQVKAAQQKSVTRLVRKSTQERSSRTLRLPPFLKCARFCNLNCLSQRVKFWVKFPGENRCKYWSVNKSLLRMFNQLIGLVKNAITKTNPEFWTTPARLNKSPASAVLKSKLIPISSAWQKHLVWTGPQFYWTSLVLKMSSASSDILNCILEISVFYICPKRASILISAA